MSVAAAGEVRSLPLGLVRRAQLRDAPGLVALLAEDLHRGVERGLVGVREHVGLGAPRTLQREALLAHVDEQLGRSLGVEVAAEAERYLARRAPVDRDRALRGPGDGLERPAREHPGRSLSEGVLRPAAGEREAERQAGGNGA